MANASMIGLVGLLAAQSAALPWPGAPDVPSLTIKTRRTTDHPNSSISTEIVYRKGPRERHEAVVDVPPQVGSAAGVTRRHLWPIILQCDERRTVTLNDEARTYAYSAIEDRSGYWEGLRAWADGRLRFVWR
jgi:hypothetical protein